MSIDGKQLNKLQCMMDSSYYAVVKRNEGDHYIDIYGNH